MGQTARTTKLLLDLSEREQGGTNRDKRRYLEETVAILDAARAFYLDFFLAHPDNLIERVEVISKQTGEVREALISADKLLTWAEFQTVETGAHPDPLPEWNFSQAFPDFPNRYRRSVIKDCIGKARGYLTTFLKWQHSGKTKGKLRTIKPEGGSKSKRLNRKQANQLRGQINQLAKEKAYAQGVVSVEVNPHGTSQYCSRCGAKGMRFSLVAGQRINGRGGKLFCCPLCRYECHADFNASCNVHHSFFREFHWQPRAQKSG